MILRAFLAVVVALVVAAGRPQGRRTADEAPKISEITMADYIWASNTGSLGAAASYSPGSGPPGANDSITFDGTSQIDASSDLAAFTGVDLERLWVKSEYEGNIGADSNPIVAGFNHVIHQGQGSLYQNVESHASTTHVVIDSPNQQDAYTLAGTAGTTSFYFKDGGVKVLSAVTSMTYVFVGGNSAAHLPVVDIDGVITFGFYSQTGGYVTSRSQATLLGLVIDGGTFVYEAAATNNNAQITKIYGGTFVYNGTGTASFVIVGNGGTLDMSQDPRAKTITRLVLLPGSNFIDNFNTTVTTKIDLRGKVPILP